MKHITKLNIKDIFRLSVILTLFALLFAAINIFYMEDPIFETLWQQIVTFHLIGFSIMFTVELSGVPNIKNSLKKGIILLIMFVLGGWIGLLNCYLVFKFIFQSQIPADWFRESIGPVTFFAVFFSLVITSYETVREKLEKTAAKLAEKEINEKNLLRLKTKAELEALRAKVNPHFLFNTLNSIASLIPIKPEKAEEMVVKLSSLFRYTLDASSHDMVRLSDEIRIIGEYLEIEKVRLGDRLTWHIEIDSKLSDMNIPGLLLQPLVENSIKHGIATKQSGGTVNIRCYRKDAYCCIEITDTGEGFLSQLTNNGFGLQAVRERLDLQYGQDYDFHLTGEDGVHIKICLPVTEQETPGE
ncbi:MAG: histidine kinase [Candidatus Latescibacteria bacterium]|nr:histidine kinase [Candidatus Latescibacterota bacterium]